MSASQTRTVRFVSPDKNKFFSTLRARVDEHFKQHKISRFANREMVLKTFILIGGYLLSFLLLCVLTPGLSWSLGLWFLMGLFLAGIGMSVMHDANHGAYSRKRWINEWVGYSLNLLGGSVFNWKLQHNVLHHTYTNVSELDDDIADKLILRFSPHTRVRGIHQLQFIYAFFFYSILTLYWVVLKDFIQFAKYTRSGVNRNGFRKNVETVVKITLLKIIYLSVMLAVPVFLLGMPFWQVGLGFALMHGVAGMVLTVIFQLAHTVEDTDHPLPNADGNIENCWAIHQLQTTVNFSPGNRFLSWYVGGLNYQIEHHLFPNVCHVHYPALSPIVRETAAEFGIPYLQNDTFMQALRSHIATLQRFGRPEKELAKAIA